MPNIHVMCNQVTVFGGNSFFWLSFLSVCAESSLNYNTRRLPTHQQHQLVPCHIATYVALQQPHSHTTCTVQSTIYRNTTESSQPTSWHITMCSALENTVISIPIINRVYRQNYMLCAVTILWVIKSAPSVFTITLPNVNYISKYLEGMLIKQFITH